MRKKRKKLSLSAETLRHLGADRLQEVTGASTPATYCCIMTGPSIACDTSYEQCYETVYTTPGCTVGETNGC
jgi:hypothetical protein